jgi:hypothetical protein
MMRHPAATALASYGEGPVSEQRAARPCRHVRDGADVPPQSIAGMPGRKAANTFLCSARSLEHVAWARGYNAWLALVRRSQIRLTCAGFQWQEQPEFAAMLESVTKHLLRPTSARGYQKME